MNTTRPLALVTGASSGIGAEISVELARRGHDLLLTGRDPGRLAETADRVRAAGGSAETQILNLGSPEAIDNLLGILGSRPLAVLVNNAGFGLSDPFTSMDPRELSAMVHLNVMVLTLLTRAIVPGMVAQGSGRILNVASTAAFQPCPGMAAYGATKAYVLSFSEALAEELTGTGVTVTALCPGATATRFADRASMGGTSLFKRAMSAERVAQIGIKALLTGRRVRITGVWNSFMAASVRISPRGLVTKIAARLMRKGP